MSNELLISKTKVALFWTTTVRFVAQLFTWLSTFFVIRYVSPESYGIVSMAEISIAMLTLISTSGFGASLIQKKELTSEDVKNLFGLILVINLSIGVLQVLLAGPIASYFKEPELISVLYALSFSFLIMTWVTIPSALLARNMEFKKRSVIDLHSAIYAGILAIAMAYNGFEYWALVASSIFASLFKAVQYTRASSFYTFPSFQFGKIKHMISFGGLVTLTSVLYAFYMKADIAIAGRFFDTATIGIFAVAAHLALLPMKKVLPIVNDVAFPFYSKFKGNSQEINAYVLKSQRLAAIVGFPIFFGLAGIGFYALPLILGEKWEAAALPFSLLCLTVPFRFILNLFSPVTKAIGKPSINLINGIIQIISITASIPFFIDQGVLGIVYAWLVATPIQFILCSVISAKVLKLHYGKFVINLLPVLLICLLMLGLDLMGYHFLVGELKLNVFLSLSLIILSSGVLYVSLMLIFMKSQSLELIGMIRREK